MAQSAKDVSTFTIVSETLVLPLVSSLPTKSHTHTHKHTHTHIYTHTHTQTLKEYKNAKKLKGEYGDQVHQL